MAALGLPRTPALIFVLARCVEAWGTWMLLLYHVSDVAVPSPRLWARVWVTSFFFSFLFFTFCLASLLHRKS